VIQLCLWQLCSLVAGFRTVPSLVAMTVVRAGAALVVVVAMLAMRTGAAFVVVVAMVAMRTGAALVVVVAMVAMRTGTVVMVMVVTVMMMMFVMVVAMVVVTVVMVVAVPLLGTMSAMAATAILLFRTMRAERITAAVAATFSAAFLLAGFLLASLRFCFLSCKFSLVSADEQIDLLCCIFRKMVVANIQLRQLQPHILIQHVEQLHPTVIVEAIVLEIQTVQGLVVTDKVLQRLDAFISNDIATKIQFHQMGILYQSF